MLLNVHPERYRRLEAGEPPSDELLRRISTIYDWKQTVDTARVRTDTVAGFPGATEVDGVWNGTVQNFPQAGPFITRLIPCPAQHRDYLLDAWLHAPASDKYEYMLQMDTILGSFDCNAS